MSLTLGICIAWPDHAAVEYDLKSPNNVLAFQLDHDCSSSEPEKDRALCAMAGLLDSREADSCSDSL